MLISSMKCIKQYFMFKLSLYPGSRDITQVLDIKANFDGAEGFLFDWIQ